MGGGGEDARTYLVAIIDGDGIGPSLISAALLVNRAAQGRHGYRLRLDRIELSDDGGSRIGPRALERIRAADAVLKGPAGQPQQRKADGTEAALLGGILRPALDAYANVRPIRSWPGAPRVSPGTEPIDYVVVRENVEGLYASRAGGARTPHGAADVLIATRDGTARIARHAFALARARAEHRLGTVTCVDKANVLPSHAFFRGVVSEVASEFPDVSFRTAHADAAAQMLVVQPWKFDVLVMENFLGDILSEVGAATVGGVGMQPSANIGPRHAYFEPAHGSAPSLLGRDAANPVGQILALAMLLEHLGETAASRAIERAVADGFQSRAVRLDGDGCPEIGTMATAEAIAARVA